LAPEPSGIRKKRAKISSEEELIRIKQEHDMEVENKRLKLEEVRVSNQLQLEEGKLELEKTRIQIEERRETRLAEENKRRDEMALAQLELQKSMCLLLSSAIHSKHNE
jgi:hypothetical protein